MGTKRKTFGTSRISISSATNLAAIANKITLLTLYSLKWENELIMRGPALDLKSYGDHVCTYEKSKYYTEGKKSNFSIGHKF